MFILNSTSDAVSVVTAAASASVLVHVSYVDYSAGTVTVGRTNTAAITTATTTTVVSAPASGTARNIKTLAITNTGSTINTVTVFHTDGTNNLQIASARLQQGDSFNYSDPTGWRYVSNQNGGGFLTAAPSAAPYTVAIGYQALSNSTGGVSNSNTAFGYGAAQYTTTGSGITGLGMGALQYNTVGTYNTGVGTGSGAGITTGIATLGAITAGSGYTNGSYTNVQSSYVSGPVALGGNYPTLNVTVAGGVVSACTLGSTNAYGLTATGTVLTVAASLIGGTGSGFSIPVATIVSAGSCTAVGNGAFATGPMTGSSNTGIGYSAAASLTSGSQNTFIGASTTMSVGTYSNSTAIGYGASITASNQIVLGNASVTSLTVAGTVVFGMANGAAATPSYAYTGATTTGLYWANPGIGFSVAAVSIGTMTATGLNGMAVGATTKSTGAFTALTASGATTLSSTLGVTGLITPTSSVGIKGTVAADSAAAGSIGEYATATSTAVSLTTSTSANATSVSLTAGDWDVWGVIDFIPAGTTTTSYQWAGVSTTSATNAGLGTYAQQQFTGAAGSTQILAAPMQRVNVSSTTTVYLVAQMGFAVSTATCNGYIYARRRR